MVPEKQAEEAIVVSSANYGEAEHEGGGKREGAEEEEDDNHSFFSVRSILWHGGSAWDAWFSCASNQVMPFSLAVTICTVEIAIMCPKAIARQIKTSTVEISDEVRMFIER